MYNSNDPRNSLATAKAGPAATEFAAAEYLRFYDMEPQLSDTNSRTWLGRGQNFIIAHSETEAGAVFSRTGQVDEYVVLLPDTKSPATVTWQGKTHDVAGYSLVIVPPGDSTVAMPSGGRMVRMFSTQSADLTAACANADAYMSQHPNIPPFQPWPEPRDGYRVRIYSLDVPDQPGRFGRIWRCTTMMVNVLPRETGPRDVNKLSPHYHDDFEQCSLVLEGTFTHHIRWPWTPRLAAWRADEHEQLGTPSITVIPPPAIHTSRGMAQDFNQLIDIFSPPRMDFSEKEGWVLNADEYPVPGELGGKI
jgi:mannose-6-phosphate isomerase-like protein (cupin superfamily)